MASENLNLGRKNPCFSNVIFNSQLDAAGARIVDRAQFENTAAGAAGRRPIFWRRRCDVRALATADQRLRRACRDDRVRGPAFRLTACHDRARPLILMSGRSAVVGLRWRLMGRSSLPLLKAGRPLPALWSMAHDHHIAHHH